MTKLVKKRQRVTVVAIAKAIAEQQVIVVAIAKAIAEQQVIVVAIANPIAHSKVNIRVMYSYSKSHIQGRSRLGEMIC